ncbi:MAG: PQQ-binding-like beta-propeller repeat protein [Planctomycetota bacterium]
MRARRNPRARFTRIAIALWLGALAAGCGGGKTGGPRAPWLWPMYQRTADRAGHAEVSGPSNGTIAWSTALESSASSLIVTEGELLLVRHGEQLSAFTRDGERLWTRKIGLGTGSPIALPEQFIFAPTDDGVLQGITRDGATSFAHVLSGRVSSPAVRSNNDLVVAYAISDAEGRVAILPPQPRPVIATLSTGPLGTASVALDAEDRVYVGSTNGSLYAFDIRRGLASPQSMFTLALGTAISRGTPAVHGKIVYVVDDADQLHSVSQSGVLFWTFKPKVTTTAGGGSTPAIHPAGYILYGSQDQHLYALRSDGSVAWSFDAGAAISSPALVDGAGNIYVRSNAGVVFGLDRNGQLRFRTELHDTITSAFDAPMVLGGGGSLFLATPGRAPPVLARRGGVGPGRRGSTPHEQVRGRRADARCSMRRCRSRRSCRRRCSWAATAGS